MEAFLGIPYAAPPVGSLMRFLPPASPGPWTGIRSANALPPACPQQLPPLANRCTRYSIFYFLNIMKELIPYDRSKTYLYYGFIKTLFHVSSRFAYRCLFQEYMINFVREEEKGKRSRERKSVKMRDRKSAKSSSSLGDTEQPMRQKRTWCSAWNILLAARYPLKSGNDVSVYL